ncbi:MAG: hypothetical protein CL947_01710 [Epsilonproteobacteria bacterium]|nr:hypothetical protein [Campylobacterota bacterium]|tara:strand:+ start:526 stop:1326 length:801 start_codon:yes stop_codon:yes gene_type:complete
MLQKLHNWFAVFLELQLVISLLSLPVLIHWGLAISYMAPIANLIFTPLLVMFLWCSCLIVLCSLIQLPCSWLVTIINYITKVWHYLLSFANPNWLIGFSEHTITLSICIALFIVGFYSKVNPKRNHAIITLIICCLVIMGFQHFCKKNTITKLRDLPMYAIQYNQKNYVIDNGGLCSKQNYYAHIDYTVLPNLIKKTGTPTIDTLYLYKPSKQLAKIALQLAQQTNITKIFITTKHGCFKQLQTLNNNPNLLIKPIRLTKLKFTVD